MMRNIIFTKVTGADLETVFSWLNEPHAMEFWDNSEEHKEDIRNFAHGKPQSYFAGTFGYWIGYIDGEYALVVSDILKKDQPDLSPLHLTHMSATGHTITLDFCIGDTGYLGKGLGALTLSAFMAFYIRTVDTSADTFFIDPHENNPRAIRVYEKAGFKKVGGFQVTQGAFIGHDSELMVKRVYA